MFIALTGRLPRATDSGRSQYDEGSFCYEFPISGTARGAGINAAYWYLCFDLRKRLDYYELVRPGGFTHHHGG